jgi:hypothetical protein
MHRNHLDSGIDSGIDSRADIGSRLSRIFSSGAAIAAVVLVAFAFGATDAGAQTLYKGTWIAESFGNDKVGGTDASEFFSVYAAPQGNLCNPVNPRCAFSSTPVAYTTTGPGTAKTFNPLGPLCTPLTGPRPVKGGTVSARVPPLYRNPAHFTPGGLANNSSCPGNVTASGAQATQYLAPFDPQRGAVMNGKPVVGLGYATLTGADFKIPAAASAPGTEWDKLGMFRTTTGSFTNVPPYLYSYSYATLRNDVGEFGVGKGFFSAAAADSTVNFTNMAGGTTVASVKVTKGAGNFGGVMRLLGQLTTKVCYFYQGGCGLGYGEWRYESIGDAGNKNKAGSVVTESFTTSFTFQYYNTALNTFAKYTVVPQRFPWTTGTVTVTATGRGPHKTFVQRKGHDNRSAGIGTVQLVSPILTQWLGQNPAVQFETGGIAVLNINIVPEPGVLFGLVAGLSLLAVAYRRNT